MRVVWSTSALSRLDDIYEYIAADDPVRAASFVAELVDRVEDQLAAHPRSGRRVAESKRYEVREMVIGNYRIPYSVHDDVEILTVFEGHMRPRGWWLDNEPGEAS